MQESSTKMSTTFTAALAICGLSHAEAANFLGVHRDTVQAWSVGASSPPRGVWKMLSGLYSRIEIAAENACASLDLSRVESREVIHLCADSEEDPLPTGADAVAGAMAFLHAVAGARE